MRVQKLILVACVFLGAVLFSSGVSILSSRDGAINTKKGDIIKLPQAEKLSNKLSAEEDKLINIMLLGLDGEEIRSDVMILLSLSPMENKLNVLSIARDTRVRVKNKWAKINSLVKMGGEALVIEKVEELTGLDIQYYITLNFEGFRKIVDTVDGVQMYIPFDMNYDDPEQNLHIHLEKGLQVLDGRKAEQLVRYRKGNRRGQGYTDGDLGRIKMQQAFLKAFISQKAKLKYISKADDIFLILRKYLKSNIEIGDINRNLPLIKNLDYDDINSYTLPGEPAYINDVWYFICDREETQKLINERFRH
ncbi:MAG: LCP family protein [Clostridia bacterium]|nr:LCP family protein [Clostridia bacterium]